MQETYCGDDGVPRTRYVMLMDPEGIEIFQTVEGPLGTPMPAEQPAPVHSKAAERAKRCYFEPVPEGSCALVTLIDNEPLQRIRHPRAATHLFCAWPVCTSTRPAP